MISIPQYPLYSAAVNMFGGKIVPYYLDEDHDWDLNVNELERAIADAQSKEIRVRALCVINPGNPTGNHLSEHSLIDVSSVCFAEKFYPDF
jgi:alanine transaminase